MITVALIVSAVAMLCSGSCLVAILVLLGRKDFAYATKADLDKEVNRLMVGLGLQGRKLSQVYRYVEAIDDHLGANGHRVLIPSLPRQESTGGDR